jgi:dethiobiotin synthetase
MPAYFVTGTGTDLGKTFVTAALVRHFRRANRKVDVLKPIASGFNADDVDASDAGVLLAALGQPLSPENIARISPWRFTAPLSPDMAAAREGRPIDFEALCGACAQAIARADDLLFIEGVGGVMTPFDGRHTVLDLMQRLKVPAIVVTGSYLGTLSHTLTALDVLTHRGIKTVAYVVSETPGSTVPLGETAAVLGGFAAPVPVLPLPRTDNNGDIAALAALLI